MSNFMMVVRASSLSTQVVAMISIRRANRQTVNKGSHVPENHAIFFRHRVLPLSLDIKWELTNLRVPSLAWLWEVNIIFLDRRGPRLPVFPSHIV